MYRSAMTGKEKECFDYGFKIGSEAVGMNISIARDDDGNPMVDKNGTILYSVDGNMHCGYERAIELAYESVDNYESYSPWEFFAHDVNESEDSETLWEAYRNGIDEGILSSMESLFNE